MVKRKTTFLLFSLLVMSFFLNACQKQLVCALLLESMILQHIPWEDTPKLPSISHKKKLPSWLHELLVKRPGIFHVGEIFAWVFFCLIFKKEANLENDQPYIFYDATQAALAETWQWHLGIDQTEPSKGLSLYHYIIISCIYCIWNVERFIVIK